jgi:F0F1-type ATP synthase membrane subunit c/vacuolar-type H+-ATPase subunit K
MKQNVEQLYKTNLVLWSVFLMSQSVFFMVLYFAKPELFKFDFTKPLAGENFVIVAAFGLMAILNLFVGLFLRFQTVQRAIEEQKPMMLQTALILGLAFCESISIFGLILALGFNYQYFFLWIILGIIGMMLHYPKRQNYHDASFRMQ